jgi:RimJ/RimL family protein N-acetyltransferase
MSLMAAESIDADVTPRAIATSPGTVSARHTYAVLDVSLRQLGPREAHDVIERRRPKVGWAHDFPTDVDAAVARLARPYPEEPVEPWSSPWLIVADEVVVGMLGFKGPPKFEEIEVGYGVVPSFQGRGVATAALGLLLAVIRDRGLDVRADTATWNVASQGVLRRLGFVEVGRSWNPKDGDLIAWRRPAASDR